MSATESGALRQAIVAAGFRACGKPLLVMDVEGRAVAASEGFAALLGLPVDALAGEICGDWFLPTGALGECSLLGGCQGGQQRQLQLRNVHGDMIPVEVTCGGFLADPLLPAADGEAGAQDTRELVERGFRVGHRSHDVLRHHDVEGAVRELELLGIHHRQPLDVLETELGDAPLRLLQHRFRNVGAEDSQMRRVLRQGNSRTDTDFEHAPADPIGRGNGGATPLAEYAAEDEIVDRRPAVIGLLDGRTVEVELLRAVKLDDFCHVSLPC